MIAVSQTVYRIITGDELRAMEPNVSPAAHASLWAPSAAITCPYGITIAAAENAATNGVHFFFNFRVSGVSEAGGIYYISNGRDTIAAHYIVNAAGVHSAEVAEILTNKDHFFGDEERSFLARDEHGAHNHIGVFNFLADIMFRTVEGMYVGWRFKVELTQAG